MQTIIIDTNVLVSALTQQGYPHLIVTNIFVNSEICVCNSNELFEEYYEVLNRDKFARFSNFITNARMLLKDIEGISIKYSPIESLI